MCVSVFQTPVCVIGVTPRLDVVELLEKRVKSRFSHRQLCVHGATCIEHYTAIALSYLTLQPTRTPPGGERWNQHVAELFSLPGVLACLRQLFHHSRDIRQLKTYLVSLCFSPIFFHTSIARFSLIFFYAVFISVLPWFYWLFCFMLYKFFLVLFLHFNWTVFYSVFFSLVLLCECILSYFFSVFSLYHFSLLSVLSLFLSLFSECFQRLVLVECLISLSSDDNCDASTALSLSHFQRVSDKMAVDPRHKMLLGLSVLELCLVSYYCDLYRWSW